MSKQKYPQTTTVTTSGTVKVKKTGRERYSQVKAHAKQDRKRNEAYARQDKYDRLTLQQQLESCVPGGSKRQRARIEAAMAKTVTVPVKTPPMTEAQKTTKALKRAKALTDLVPH